MFKKKFWEVLGWRVRGPNPVLGECLGPSRSLESGTVRRLDPVPPKSSGTRVGAIAFSLHLWDGSNDQICGSSVPSTQEQNPSRPRSRTRFRRS